MSSVTHACAIVCQGPRAAAVCLLLLADVACSNQTKTSETKAFHRDAPDAGAMSRLTEPDSGGNKPLAIPDPDAGGLAAAEATGAVDAGFEGHDGSGEPPSNASSEALRGNVPADYDKDSELCRPAQVMFNGGLGCVISESAHLHCWGVNSAFNTGVRGGEPCGTDPEALCVRDPVIVPGIDSVVDVAAGGGATCAIRTDGTVWCWGSNIAGLLGEDVEEICDGPGVPIRDGQPQSCTPDPVRIPGISRATDIDSWGAMCASTESGQVLTWGWYSRTSPTPVPGVTSAVAVEDGCALLADGGVVCWPPDTLIAERIDWNGVATDMTLGYAMGCVIDEQGALSCWNLDSDWDSTGATDGSFDCTAGISCAYAAHPFELDRPVIAASGSYEVMWVLTDDGKVSAIVLGELNEPLDLPAPATQISAGTNGACAILDEGSVYCWANPGIENQYLDLGPKPTAVELCQELP